MKNHTLNTLKLNTHYILNFKETKLLNLKKITEKQKKKSNSLPQAMKTAKKKVMLQKNSINISPVKAQHLQASSQYLPKV